MVVLFETDDVGAPVLTERLELPPPLVFHRFRGPRPHPLDGAAVLITRFAGEGFLNKMRKRGIEVRQTRETDARKAAADYLAGTLAPPPSVVSVPKHRQHLRTPQDGSPASAISAYALRMPMAISGGIAMPRSCNRAPC